MSQPHAGHAVYPGAPYLPGYPGAAPSGDGKGGSDAGERSGMSFARGVTIAGVLVFLFGVACMITALVLAVDDGPSVRATILPTGGTIGPIEVRRPNTVLEIDFRQNLHGLGWAYVDGELQDAEDNTLLGFGGEMWHEQGYDDGHWDEQENQFDLKVTVPEKGTYFAEFNVEQQPGTPIGGNIAVSVTPKLGSSIPHFAAGLFGLIIGILLFVAGRMQAQGSAA